MDSPASTKSHELAPQLEDGSALSQATPDSEKPTLRSSTVDTTGGTFVSRGTFGSISPQFKRAKTWASSVGSAMLPRISHGKTEITVAQLETYPEGYPRFSCYLDSDDAFTMYRRFGQLHARVLLRHQDRLRCLEEELSYLDRADDATEEGQGLLRCREDDEAQEPPAPPRRSRTMVLDEVEKELKDYGQILQQSQQLVAMNRPSKQDHRSVVNYIQNEQPLMEGDRNFIYHQEDLVTIRSGRENAWLDALIEKVLRWYPCKPIKYLFCSETSRRKTTNEAIHYFSRGRINAFVTLIITLIILVLLVVPIYVLFYLTIKAESESGDGQGTQTICIGVLLVSTLIFSSVLSMFTRAKRHEILAAAAGYCAVLVVFLGNIGINSPQSNALAQ